MAATKYTYSISTDFPNHAVATDRLLSEVRASAIVTAVDYINTSGDDCDIWFKDALSAGDETVLDGIVAAHSGEPLPSTAQQVILTSTSGGAAELSSNRMLVVNFPADFGANLWLTSRGDDLVNQVRGRGTKLAHKFDDVTRTEPEVKSVEIQFMEQIQLHDGHIDLANPAGWDITTDEWELSIVMDANVVTPNVGNTGNCNLVDLGGYNAIVPAAGDGAYDVDLATAVPIPQAGGGWSYDYKTNVLEPTDPASSSWTLLDVPIEVFVQIAVNVPASPMGVFDFDAYDAQRVSPRWKIKFTVRKSSNGPGSIAGWIVCFRSLNT